jgi:hypothetical protein
MGRRKEIVQLLAVACSKCGILKPLGDFYTDRSAANGVRAYCKSCDNAHRKLNYKKGIVNHVKKEQ